MDAVDFPFVQCKRDANEKVMDHIMDLLYFFLSNLAGSQVQMIQRKKYLKIVSRCIVPTAMVFHSSSASYGKEQVWLDPGCHKVGHFWLLATSFLFWKASH